MPYQPFIVKIDNLTECRSQRIPVHFANRIAFFYRQHPVPFCEDNL